MKKSTLLAIIALVMALAMGITGTMAYLQDTDEDVNVMTLGNVYIDQIELERNEDGELTDFTQAKPLFPAVYESITWDDESQAWPFISATANSKVFDDETMQNVQDKFVFVKNTGKSDAYVRTIFAFEIGSFDTSIVHDKLIHLNLNDKNSSETKTGHWAFNWISEPVEIDGGNYALAEAIYLHKNSVQGTADEGKLPAGVTSYPSLLQVFLDKTADNEDVAALDGNGNGTYDILVVSQAVQTMGFANAQEALDEAFGKITATSHPWVNGAAVPVMVESAADLRAALEAGETDIVVKGAAINENFFNGHYYKDRNVDFVDCTFTAHMNYMYINDASFTNCTFDAGSANAAVHYDELFGDLVFNNCTFNSGKIQIGANAGMTGTVTFNNCTFAETAETSIWSEKGIRVYSPATFNSCEFNNRVVMAGSNGLSVTFDGCTMNGGTPVYYVDNTDGIIRGGNIPTVTVK